MAAGWQGSENKGEVVSIGILKLRTGKLKRIKSGEPCEVYLASKIALHYPSYSAILTQSFAGNSQRVRTTVCKHTRFFNIAYGLDCKGQSRIV